MSDNVLKVNWKRKPTLDELKSELRSCGTHHASKVAAVDKYLHDLYKGGAPKKINPNKSNIAPKVTRKLAEWRYPSLTEPYLATPNIYQADARTGEDAARVKQSMILLNYFVNKRSFGKVKLIGDIARALVNEGSVVTRASWDFLEQEQETYETEFEFKPSSDENISNMYQSLSMNPQGADMIDEATLAGFQYSMEHGGVFVAVPRLKQVRKLMTVTSEPVVDVCDYRSVIVDPMCKGVIHNAKFVIYPYDTNLAELTKGDFYNISKVREELKKDLNSARDEHQSGGGEADRTNVYDSTFDTDSVDDFAYANLNNRVIRAYEYNGYWDIHKAGEMVAVKITWVHNTIVQMEETPMPDGALPFTLMQYIPTKGVYGHSDGEMVNDNQQILGALTRSTIDTLAHTASGQVGFAPRALSLHNQRRFDAGLSFTFNEGIRAEDAFTVMKFPDISPTALNVMHMINADNESITGIKAFGTSGLSGESIGKTATGIRGTLDAAALRELDVLRRMTEGIVDIGYKLLSMINAFLPQEEVEAITGEKYVPPKPNNLSGELDLVVNISSTAADAMRAEQLAFMLQTGQQSDDPNEVRIVKAKLADLQNMPDLAKQFREFKPTPNPLEEERAKLEIELLKAQIQNEYAKASENEANGLLDRAKADLIDLDFVEQEGGTKQERELQKLNEQKKDAKNAVKPK